MNDGLGRRQSDGVRPRVTFVVPCFEEEKRLPRDELKRLLNESTDLTLLFVDDGSRDGTRNALEALRLEVPDRVRVLGLTQNRGKGEAVRIGMRHALLGDADCVGYFDADMATSTKDLRRLMSEIRDPSVAAVLGSRVQLMGHVIQRSTYRHYAGRGFATAASLLLAQPFYDTQCGAKLFRRSPLLEAMLDEPFLTRWLFDVELLGRLLTGTETLAPVVPTALRELPLRNWRDVPGSKIGARDAAQSALALAFVWLDLARRRARARRRP
jgi:dolichyl-phosphate beta-glucosyltransferase